MPLTPVPDGFVVLASQDVLHHAFDIATGTEGLAARPFYKYGVHVRAGVPVGVQLVQGLAHGLIQRIQ